ncbi:Oxygen-dependent choline dehydrogenase [Purpureocillium lavendulum]|uniref:Oxygen-dependent choline dehydrogenase n=1 Tax=Purpureocillium lavendulum TaxID=1247861 RepID=A0AB34FWH4_9HYPO|nr:Oxygen-dependent choline dehydrogenase [Purpureocillium lavendulum]
MESSSQELVDFVVVGGGTAGSVIAARLSENPDAQVCVIEAGLSRAGDPNVDMPTGVGKMLGNPDYDWNYHSVPQGLGIKGWSFNDLLPYFKRHEMLEANQPNITERDISERPLDVGLHGLGGPIHTSMATWSVPFETPLLAALDDTSGIPRPVDPYNGSHLGFYRSLLAIDRTARPVRSYAATGYLPVSSLRPNLRVLTSALVTRIILEPDSDGILTARGVEINHQGSIRRILATKEVILCAGSLKSPQILELSGIGDQSVLQNVNIPCLQPNSHVGSNLQEKTMAAVVYELGPDEMSLDSLFRDVNFAKEHLNLYMNSHTGALSGSNDLMGFVPFASLANSVGIDEAVGTAVSTTPSPGQNPGFQQKQQRLIAARLRDRNSASIQLLASPANFNIAEGHANCAKLISGPPPGTDRSCYGLIVSNMYPLSRGTVHIRSSDPEDEPAIDPGFLTHPSDAHILATGLAFADRVFQSKHLEGKVGRRVDPPPEVNLQDDDSARRFVRERIVSYHHALGTCALGQVVDDRLRVKGIRGLRVCDASVLPMQVSAAILATVYAVAEKAAEMIASDNA